MNTLEKKKLKAQAHPLKPVVMIGNAGLTDAVIKEINLALDHHELIKVKIRAERDLRLQLSERICIETLAIHIQAIGQIMVFYRKNLKK